MGKSKLDEAERLAKAVRRALSRADLEEIRKRRSEGWGSAVAPVHASYAQIDDLVHALLRYEAAPAGEP